MSSNGNRPQIYGRNYHKGFTPGGFTQHFRNRRDDEAPRRKRCEAREIKEAASIVLENRQMPRAEEAAAKLPTQKPNEDRPNNL